MQTLPTAPRVRADSFPIPCALIVVPDDDTREMYVESLRAVVADLEIAHDGAEALAVAIARPPSVIVMDTHVPIIDGYELCRLLRADVATRAGRIVVITGDSSAGSLERARLAGADAVLTKPYLPEALTEALIELTAPSPEREPPRIQGPSLVGSRFQGKTATPPLSPPALICPQCDLALRYVHSHLGGVNARNSEQWDYYVCPRGCGTYHYRHRTRRLRMARA